jgi:FG-GAP-like repeat
MSRARNSVALVTVMLFGSMLPANAFHFQQHRYRAGHGPNALTLGDFNNDGKSDIAVANACGDKLCETNGVVAVLLNNGDGTFARRIQSQSADSGSSIALTAADFDNDGNLDLAVVNTAVNQLGDVTILLGKGNGRFDLVNAYGLGEVPLFVRAGDFNHDGKTDIAVTLNNPPKVAVLLGNGDGSFQSPVLYDVEEGPQDLAVADVNNDGNLDLLVVNECGHTSGCRQGTVSVLLGKGDGTLQAQQSYFVGIFPLEVAVADFNADGNPDLVLDLPCGTDSSCVSNGGVGVLLGNGDGSFQSVVNYAATGMDTARVGTGFLASSNKSDIIALNYQTSNITVFRGKGDGTFAAGKTFAVGGDPVSVATGDLNGDNEDDAVVLNETDHTVSVLLDRRK